MAEGMGKAIDSSMFGRGLTRAPLSTFVLRLIPWFALLGFGLYAVYLCFAHGLNQTNMDNRFAFGLWIFLDLTIIAIGAAAKPGGEKAAGTGQGMAAESDRAGAPRLADADWDAIWGDIFLEG